MAARLIEFYKKQIVPEVMKEHALINSLQVPRLQKIVVNMGVGMGAHDIKILEQAASELGIITGQKPSYTRARKSIANFKIRKDSPVGCRVTLRGARMYEFLDRLVNVALPRIKDFRGLSKRSFDEHGNYSFGLNEQTIFPEIDIDKVTKLQGMHITIVTTGKDKALTLSVLKGFNFPFKQE